MGAVYAATLTTYRVISLAVQLTILGLIAFLVYKIGNGRTTSSVEVQTAYANTFVNETNNKANTNPNTPSTKSNTTQITFTPIGDVAWCIMHFQIDGGTAQNVGMMHEPNNVFAYNITSFSNLTYSFTCSPTSGPAYDTPAFSLP